MSAPLHIVTGAGPVGSTVAQQLVEQGISVRMLTRSGSGPDHPLIERRRVDVADRDRLAAELQGASAVHHCVHGTKYRAATWRRELPAMDRGLLAVAGEAGAVVVFPESLYSYGPVEGVITEDGPREATQGKLGCAPTCCAPERPPTLPRSASPPPTSSDRACVPPTPASD
jgi:nucleoside-diphosphate-sugar epimerase